MDNETLKRKKKLLLFAPVVFIPFLSLLFWSAGGGSENKPVDHAQEIGINMDIPKTNEMHVLTKEQAYQKYLEDSIQKMNHIKNENLIYNKSRSSVPTYIPTNASNGSNKTMDNSSAGRVGKNFGQTQNNPYANKTQYINNPNTAMPALGKDDEYINELKQKLAASRVDKQKAEDNYRILKDQQAADQQTIHALRSDTLEKDQLTPVKKTEKSKPVEVVYELVPAHKYDQQNKDRFYNGIGAEVITPSSINTISCVIANDQTVINGTVVKIRLTENTKLAEMAMPENSFIYGVAQLQAERLNLIISSIEYQGGVYPVKMMIYDLDGLPGLRIPGSVNQAIANQGKSELVNAAASPFTGGGGLNIFQSSNTAQQLVGQATSAVVQVGKTIVGQKVAITKVFLKANYKILLKQSSQ